MFANNFASSLAPTSLPYDPFLPAVPIDLYPINNNKSTPSITNDPFILNTTSNLPEMGQAHSATAAADLFYSSSAGLQDVDLFDTAPNSSNYTTEEPNIFFASSVSAPTPKEHDPFEVEADPTYFAFESKAEKPSSNSLPQISEVHDGATAAPITAVQGEISEDPAAALARLREMYNLGPLDDNEEEDEEEEDEDDGAARGGRGERMEYS